MPTVTRLEGEYTGRLRHCFENQHARHHRQLRKMTLEMRLVNRDIFNRGERLAGVALNDAIDQQKRVTMRQMLKDCLNVHYCVHGVILY